MPPSLLPALLERIGRSFGKGKSLTEPQLRNLYCTLCRAFSEIVGHPLPYEDVVGVHDRMWEIAPSLVRYDVTEPTSTEIALAGLNLLSGKTGNKAASGVPFKNPILNFYQTDPISRAYVACSMSCCRVAYFDFADPSRWLNALDLSPRGSTTVSPSQVNKPRHPKLSRRPYSFTPTCLSFLHT